MEKVATLGTTTCQESVEQLKKTFDFEEAMDGEEPHHESLRTHQLAVAALKRKRNCQEDKTSVKQMSKQLRRRRCMFRTIVVGPLMAGHYHRPQLHPQTQAKKTILMAPTLRAERLNA